MDISSSELWVKCLKQRSSPQLRLFCFPYGGSGISAFNNWGEYMPAEVEVWAIQLPGREERSHEESFKETSALIKYMAPIIYPYLEMPFAFFGHSLGALLSFELTRFLRKQYAYTPQLLLASGYPAPHISNLPPTLHELSEEEFIVKLRQLEGIPEEILQDEYLRQLFLPVLRADFSLCCTYCYKPEEPLEYPISVFGGRQDNNVHPESLLAWQHHTNSSFSLRLFEGGHFFIHLMFRLWGPKKAIPIAENCQSE